MKLNLTAAVAAGFLAVAVAGSAQAAEPGKFTPAQARSLEDWSYAAALNAATWGSPIVTMYALRDNDAVGPNVKAAPNDIWRMANTSTPELAEKAGYVLPNLSVIYGFGFLDLRREPVVLSLPGSGGLYYMVETVDMWTNAFAYPAGVQAGYKGGKFAYVGPGWKGELPSDLKRIDAPTPWVLIQPRVHLPNQSGLEAARKVLAAITTQTLSSYLGKPAPPAAKYDYAPPQFVNPKLPVSDLDFKDPLLLDHRSRSSLRWALSTVVPVPLDFIDAFPGGASDVAELLLRRTPARLRRTRRAFCNACQRSVQ